MLASSVIPGDQVLIAIDGTWTVHDKEGIFNLTLTPVNLNM